MSTYNENPCVLIVIGSGRKALEQSLIKLLCTYDYTRTLSNLRSSTGRNCEEVYAASCFLQFLPVLIDEHEAVTRFAFFELYDGSVGVLHRQFLNPWLDCSFHRQVEHISDLRRASD